MGRVAVVDSDRLLQEAKAEASAAVDAIVKALEAGPEYSFYRQVEAALEYLGAAEGRIRAVLG